MAKQTFSVGQVLTAAQMTSLQQTAMLGGSATAKTTSYTLVAADAGTVVSVNSTSATTITVNTGLFAAGDTVTIQNWGSGAVTITAGTATVNTAGSLIVPQYDGGVLYFTSTSAAIYFDWVQAGATSPLTTKGDIWGYSTSDARIPVGANDTVLTADSTQALGVKWATPSAGAYTLLSTTTLSGTTTNITGISTSYKFLYVVYFGVYGTVNGNEVKIRFNNDSGNNYNVRKVRTDGTQIANNENGIVLTRFSSTNDAANFAVGTLLLPNYAASETKIWSNPGGGSAQQGDFGIGTYASNTAISELNFYVGGAGSYSGGTVRVYGVN